MNRAVTLRILRSNASIVVDFGYDKCSMISLFKLLREKVLFKVRNRTFTNFKYCIFFLDM